MTTNVLVVSFRLAFIAVGLFAVPKLSFSVWVATVLHPQGSTGSFGYVAGPIQYGSSRVNGTLQAFRWEGNSESAFDITPMGYDAGTVLGGNTLQRSGFARINGLVHAGIWSGSQENWTDLNPQIAQSSEALDADGETQVGYANLFSSTMHAGMWTGSSSSFVDLHPDGYSMSLVEAVDETGQYGYVSIPTNTYIAAKWNGSANSFESMAPQNSVRSYIYDSSGGMQGGWADFDTQMHAGIWFGSATTFVDLNPSGAISSYIRGVHGNLKVGGAQFGSVFGAALWDGGASSFQNLHEVLSSEYEFSNAEGVWVDSFGIYVMGYARTRVTEEFRAILWFQPVPEPGSTCALGFAMVSLLSRRRKRLQYSGKQKALSIRDRTVA